MPIARITQACSLLCLLIVASLILAYEPRRDDNSRKDAFGDALPSGAISRMGTHRYPMSPGTFAVLPDGKSYVTTSAKTILVVDLATGKIVRRLPTEQEVDDLLVSANGKMLVSVEEGRIRLWDVSTWRESKQIQLAGNVTVTSRLALTADGKVLVGELAAGPGNPNDLRAWDVETAKELWKRPVEEEITIFVQGFTSDGKALVLRESRQDTEKYLLLDATTGKPAGKLNVPNERGEFVFSPDFKTLAYFSLDVDDLDLHLWDVEKAKVLHKIKGANDNEIKGIAFSPTGKLLYWLSSKDQSVHLLDVASGKERQPIAKGTNEIALIQVFCEDSRLLISRGTDFQVWDVGNDKKLYPQADIAGPVRHVFFASDGGSIFSVSLDPCLVRVWAPATGKEIRRWEVDLNVHAYANSPDGRLIAFYQSIGEHRIRIWDTESGKEQSTIKIPLWHIYDITFTPDGKKIVAGMATSQTKKGKPGALQFWDVATGQQLSRIALPHMPTGSLITGADSNLFIAPTPFEGIQAWKVGDGSKASTVPILREPTYLPTLSTNGKTLALVRQELSKTDPKKSPTKPAILLWEMSAGRVRTEIPLHSTQDVRTLAFSPDDAWLAVGFKSGMVQCFDARTGQLRREFRGHEAGVNTLRFAPDGKLLASGSSDRTILLWDIAHDAKKEVPPNLSDQALNCHWESLASLDASKAFQSLSALVGAPSQSARFLRGKLQPAQSVAPKALTPLLKQLDSDDFADRENAERELEELGDRIEPMLRKALEETTSGKIERRIDRLLKKFNGVTAAPGELRDLRAVEVLEHVGSDEARQVLEALTKGDKEARLTREAKASLERLKARR